MYKVRNKKAINRISMRALRSGGIRNITAIAAIILTSVMFTALFTVGKSVAESFQLSTMRQVGTISHGGFKFISLPEYERVKSDPKVRDISYNIFVGFGENPELDKLITEMRFTEEKAARWSFNMPTTGTLPKERLDLATTTEVLDALGVPHEIGAEVPMEFRTDGESHKEVFNLCGFWEGDVVSGVNQIFVSREYCDEVAPVFKDGSFRKEGLYSGSVNASLFFSDSWDLEKKMEALKERCGFGSEINEGSNWAYMSESIDVMSLILIFGIPVIIMLSGYLIIYNVFYISVNNDIRFYGLLKTIGTTRRQLKGIVRRQAVVLSLIGIPIGLITGYVVAVIIFPYVMSMTTVSENVISADPFIFVCSALFSFVTVGISCIKPCRLAGRISPIEAVRYTGNISASKKQRKPHKLSAFSMAMRSLGRNKAKTAVVVLSLSLSLIVLNAVAALVRGLDMDKYIQDKVVSDFCITDASVLNEFSEEKAYNSISPEVRRNIENISGVTDVGCVYMREESEHALSEEELTKAKKIFEDNKDAMPEIIKESDKKMLTENKISCHIYGVDGMVIDKLEINKGSFDREKFSDGNYVIASTYIKYAEGAELYLPGDKVRLKGADGAFRDYEVMALGEIPFALGPGHAHGFDVYFILPSEEFIRLTGEDGAMKMAYDTTEEEKEKVGEWTENYCENIKPELGYVSAQTYMNEFREMKSTFVVVGGLLSFILAVIGILNFINAEVTSVRARRHELAVLRAVGMTGGQLKKMLICEGLCYIAFTFIFVLVIGTLLTQTFIYAVSRQMWYFTYHSDVRPMLLLLPGLLVFSVLIPYICYANICKKSIVDRLRETQY